MGEDIITVLFKAMCDRGLVVSMWLQPGNTIKISARGREAGSKMLRAEFRIPDEELVDPDDYCEQVISGLDAAIRRCVISD